MSKDVPSTFEHFQSYFIGDILVCCDKVKKLPLMEINVFSP